MGQLYTVSLGCPRVIFSGETAQEMGSQAQGITVNRNKGLDIVRNWLGKESRMRGGAGPL